MASPLVFAAFHFENIQSKHFNKCIITGKGAVLILTLVETSKKLPMQACLVTLYNTGAPISINLCLTNAQTILN